LNHFTTSRLRAQRRQRAIPQQDKENDMQRKKKEVRNTSAILKTYTAGATLAELQEKFGIKGKGQLASAVLDALIKSGKMPEIARGRGKKELPTEFKVAVNLRGTIVLPKEAVSEAFHFTQGQSFIARRRGKKIILTLAE
jgi:hypothetical protein